MRILLVDEDSELVKSYLALFEHLGYEAQLRRNGTEAMETVKQWRPHVVMLNLALANFDGFDFAARLRRDPDLRPRLLIATTGHDRERRRATTTGDFDHRLPTPNDRGYLRTILQDCEMAMMDSFIQPTPIGQAKPR